MFCNRHFGTDCIQYCHHSISYYCDNLNKNVLINWSYKFAWINLVSYSYTRINSLKAINHSFITTNATPHSLILTVKPIHLTRKIPCFPEHCALLRFWPYIFPLCCTFWSCYHLVLMCKLIRGLSVIIIDGSEVNPSWLLLLYRSMLISNELSVG